MEDFMDEINKGTIQMTNKNESSENKTLSTK